MIAEALFLEHRTRKTTSLTEPSSWFRNFIFGGLTESNVEINTETALTLSAVFNAVTLISDAHKVAPLQVYHRINDGKELADDHGVYKLLHRKPNREMTPGMFKWFISASKLLWGNGFAEIERDGAGRPMALWPIHPSVVEMLRDGSKTYYYKVYPSDNNVPVAIPRENMLHVPGFAANGMWGVSVIKYAAESLGVGLAAQKYGARFFGNDARPSVIIKHPEHFKTEEAMKRFKESWQEAYGGKHQHRTAVLENGIDVHTIGMPNEDAQFLETRSFGIADVARWFNIPPHKLKDLSRATFSNIEHQSLEYVGDTIIPHFVDFEEACEDKLLRDDERDRYFCEFNAEGLLRGDQQSRYAAYQTGINAGFMSRNEARRRENMNPIDGLDDILMAVNLTTVERFNEQEEINKKRLEAMDEQEPEDDQQSGVEADTEDGEEDDEKDEAARQVLVDAWQRVTKREVSRVKAAVRRYLIAGDSDGFVAWVGQFYERFEPEVRLVISPGMRVIRRLNGDDVDADDDAVTAEAYRYCSKSKGQLAGLLRDTEPHLRPDAIEDRLKEWTDAFS